MNRVSVLLIALFLIASASSLAYADEGDMTFTLDRQEFFFRTGQEAVIQLHVDNNHGNQIDGTLTYTIGQSLNSNTMQYSSKNTRSSPFSVADGKSDIPMNFGRSDRPMTLALNMTFSYNEEEELEIVMEDIIIHFVEDPNQQQENQGQQGQESQEQMSSSSRPPGTSQEGQQDMLSQQQEKMQEMMDQMMGKGDDKQSDRQHYQQQPAERKLNNNQMAQDSSALKEQMQEQLKQQDEMERQFRDELSGNEQLKKARQDLKDKGYSLKESSISPSGNMSGDFSYEYEKQDGKKASIEGSMENGTITDMKKQTDEMRQDILQQLEQDEDFKRLEKGLKDENMSRQSPEFYEENNESFVRMDYKSKDNRTASIKARVVNGTVEDVELVEDGKEDDGMLRDLILLLLAAAASYILYRRYFSNGKKDINMDRSPAPARPKDYRKDARSMLDMSRKMFDRGEMKEAYATAAGALRYYLRHRDGLSGEMTNDGIISHLRKQRKGYTNAKECFDLCSLVEFARYKANRKDFDRIVCIAGKLIG